MSINTNIIKQELVFHHSGLLVKNIYKSIENYSQIFGQDAISQIYEISSQKVWVCFVKLNNDVYIELVQPFDDNDDFNQYFKRNISYYHNAYMSDNFDSFLGSLTEKGLRVINVFNSEAFDNKRCAFLLTKEFHLFELIEK